MTAVILATGALLFCIGLFLVITRRNAILALVGVELMLNAANLNWVVFSRVDELPARGHSVALFVIAIAAAEVAVALAIVLQVYKRFRTIELDEMDTLGEE